MASCTEEFERRGEQLVVGEWREEVLEQRPSRRVLASLEGAHSRSPASFHVLDFRILRIT